MTDNADGETLLNDTTGKLAWQCYKGGDFAQVRDAYKKRYGVEPQFVLQRDGLWWLGPVEVKR